LGAQLAEYLAETRPADEANPAAGAFLVDLARFEWTLGEVFDGPGAEKLPLLSSDALTRIGPERWADVHLVPVACLRLLALDYPVHDYYRALRDDADAFPPAPAATRLAVTRRDYVVRHYPLEPAQHALLAALLSGVTVGAAIEAAVADWDAPPEQLAGRLRAWFAFWAAEGFFLAAE
jgi:hypothetical protein